MFRALPRFDLRRPQQCECKIQSHSQKLHEQLLGMRQLRGWIRWNHPEGATAAYAAFLNAMGGLRSTPMTRGIVVTTPTPNNAHPAPFRASLRSLSPSNRPKP